MIYRTLLCSTVHPKCTPQPPVCSIPLDDATAATEQWLQCAHHRPTIGGEERESHRANSKDGDY